MNKKAWIEIETRGKGEYALIYHHFDQPYGVRDAAAFIKDFYRKPISNQYKLLEDANNGYIVLKCKKDNLSKFKNLLKINNYKYKENMS